MDAGQRILNLLYEYAERIDTGDLDGAASLFAHARLRIGSGDDEVVDSVGLLAFWKSMIKLHPDGTPRTKHLITNPLVEIDADGTATCRSYYSVLQQTDDLPLQVIAAGRYHDWFECVDDEWRFRFRDYTLLDFAGNLSHHLNHDPDAAPRQ